MTATDHLISVEEVLRAKHRLRGVAMETPLQRNERLSQRFGANIYLKREDLQVVRSYKIRGSYNKMSVLSQEELDRGVVCASAGNHAQGLAFACNKMRVHGTIFMPQATPAQKVSKVKMFGGEFVTVVLTGDTYDDAYAESIKLAEAEGRTFVHPFDDPYTIAGQGTVGLEILDADIGPIDILVMAIGGGGLSAGVGSVFRQMSPATQIIGVEPAGAPSMHESLKAGRIVRVEKIDNFVDGAAVRQVGATNFPIVQSVLERVELVPEGKVCATMLEVYNEDGLVVEPAGALSVAALDQLGDITGKTIVCTISGGNNDVTRMAEIQERAQIWSGHKQYFILEFPQRAGALREFLAYLGPNDDIAHFEYIKKHNRAKGPALIAIEFADTVDIEPFWARLEAAKFNYKPLNDNPILYDMMV